MKIKTVLATKGMKVVTIGPDQTLKEAIGLLAQHNIGALVVVENDGHPVGVISERDIVRALAQQVVFRQHWDKSVEGLVAM
jgi:CBS domain-containing protein